MDVYGQGQGTAANQLWDATKKGLAKYTMSERTKTRLSVGALVKMAALLIPLRRAQSTNKQG